MVTNLPNISKEILDEYYKKIQQRKIIESECKNLSEKIKYEMSKVNRKEIILFGYKISIETKYEPIPKFFDLLEQNELSHLINRSISGNHLKTAKRYLQFNDEDMNNYMQEKKSKWLHVNRNM